jgi:hypothetical protein
MVRPAVTRANTLKKTPTARKKNGKTLKVHHVKESFLSSKEMVKKSSKKVL